MTTKADLYFTVSTLLSERERITENLAALEGELRGALAETTDLRDQIDYGRLLARCVGHPTEIHLRDESIMCAEVDGGGGINLEVNLPTRQRGVLEPVIRRLLSCHPTVITVLFHDSTDFPDVRPYSMSFSTLLWVHDGAWWSTYTEDDEVWKLGKRLEDIAR